MSFMKSSNWHHNNLDRRGRGGRSRGRGGFGGPHRGGWGRNNFHGGPQHGNKGWGDWRHDYSGPGNRQMNQQWQNKPKRDAPEKRLSEEDIGVTEFVSDHEGFGGVIKSRYSDFQVSEINEEGEVAKLTDMTAPTPVDDKFEEDEDLLFTKYNLEILPMNTWDSINKLVVTKEDPAAKVEVDVTGMSKEQRTKIHDAVKKAFGDSIVGSTVNEGDKKIVRFVRYRKGVRVDNRVKWTWPGEYVYFIVYKENCDTMDAAARIAENLRINLKASLVGYAGSKDRRAKTSQWFSVKRVDPRRLLSAAAVCGPSLRIGNFTFRSQPLKLGMLQGNKFRIALRNVTGSDADVENACSLLQSRGFVNYYGLQRFGTRLSLPTYSLGLLLLQGKYKQAIDSILCDEGGGHRPSHHSRMAQHLARTPRDLVGALQKIPRNQRLLYLHSYQSLVWNRAVTERIKRFGYKPAVGDFVPLTSIDGEELIDEESDEEEASEKEEQETSSTNVKPETVTQNETEKEEKEQKNTKFKIPVKTLTQEDVDSGSYTIFDIIMPLPGFNIDYPPNIKDYYEELISKDGLTLELRNKIKSYSMSGAYRHVVARPKDIEWSLVRYDDPTADLILSDADLMQARELTGLVPDGKYRALLLTMSLPASCYATMALRELMKVDTSGHKQATLNNYHKRKLDDSNSETTDESGKKEKESVENEEGNDTKVGKEDEMTIDEKPEENKTTNGEKENSESEGSTVKKIKLDDSNEQ